MSTTTPSQQQRQRAANLARLLRTAFPTNWQKHLRVLGVADPAALPPEELAEFADQVFWRVKQMGIEDPAAWLVTHRTLMEARPAMVVPVELEAPVETAAGYISVRQDSVELEPGKLGTAPAKTSSPPPPKPVAATPTSRTTEPVRPRRADAAIKETKGPKTEATPLHAMGGKQGRGGGRQLKKQKLRADVSIAGRKRSLERMLFVIESLREVPILHHAAREAGIHGKTLEYWMKCSQAGNDGYDIEREGVIWRFHELCEMAIDEAHDEIHAAAWESATGLAYKYDELLLSLGYEGPEAYLRDENGIPVQEIVRKPNGKMQRFLLEWGRPEEFGKRRKVDVPHKGGVLVLGDIPKKLENNSAASIKVRKWKAGLRMIGKAKT